MPETSSSASTSMKLQRIAELAQGAPDMAITTLAHHIDHEFLVEAYRRTRKGGSTGVDGQTADEYRLDLDGNLELLLNRVKSGNYRAPPVRRVRIPKGDGDKTRPIGIPTVEDKVLQKAVSMVLEAVYEQDFSDCSYGFRPRRSAHQALNALWHGVMGMYGGWVVEVDVTGFFDNLEHHHLREILSKRVRDGVLTRLVGKWLNAGVMECGVLSYPESGTPQGGVISPLLANIYLHEVLDRWWAKDIRPRLIGMGELVRYADDFVMVFQHKRDAERMMAVLPKRFGKYGLELHPEKTRMVRFISPQNRHYDGTIEGKPGSFDFLGFTHYWGRTRKGTWVAKRKTAKSRLRRTIKRANAWLRRKRHRPVRWQHKKLSQALYGHYAYFGLTGNQRSMLSLRWQIICRWRKWLNRRSWKGQMPWEKFNKLLQHYPLPVPRVVRTAMTGAKP